MVLFVLDGGGRSPDISLSACSLPLRSVCPTAETSCGEAVLEVMANLDLVTDGDTTTYIGR
jgi:hypothetical protein